MKKAAYNIMPGTEEILKALGEQIKLARLRRDLSAELVAERAGISRSSLWKVESRKSSGCHGNICRCIACSGKYGLRSPAGRKR